MDFNPGQHICNLKPIFHVNFIQTFCFIKAAAEKWRIYELWQIFIFNFKNF